MRLYVVYSFDGRNYFYQNAKAGDNPVWIKSKQDSVSLFPHSLNSSSYMPYQVRMKIASAFKNVRKILGLSVKDFGVYTNKSPEQVTDIEMGKVAFPLEPNIPFNKLPFEESKRALFYLSLTINTIKQTDDQNPVNDRILVNLKKDKKLNNLLIETKDFVSNYFKTNSGQSNAKAQQ